MNNKEKEHLDHSQPARRTTRRKQDKMNRTLNYLIGIVSILIVISLFVIFTGNDEQEAMEEPVEETQVETKPEEEVAEEAGVAEEPNVEEESSPQDEDKEPIEGESTESGANTPVVSSSDQPVVDEVWTSDAWEPYPTAQTGEHTSTFTEGHIDYEEKLNAIYSVIPLEQQASILWSIKNNGNAKSAIAVLSSTDKEQKYRVAIEWVEGEGWMPQQVEVLNTLEGTY